MFLSCFYLSRMKGLKCRTTHCAVILNDLDDSRKRPEQTYMIRPIPTKDRQVRLFSVWFPEQPQKKTPSNFIITPPKWLFSMVVPLTTPKKTT